MEKKKFIILVVAGVLLLIVLMSAKAKGKSEEKQEQYDERKSMRLPDDQEQAVQDMLAYVPAGERGWFLDLARENFRADKFAHMRIDGKPDWVLTIRETWAAVNPNPAGKYEYNGTKNLMPASDWEKMWAIGEAYRVTKISKP